MLSTPAVIVASYKIKSEGYIPSEFLKMQEALPRIRHQVRVADQVIINKIGRCEEQVRSRIRQKVTSLNSFADVVEVSYCRVPRDRLWREMTDGPVAVRQALGEGLVSGGRPPIESAVVRTTQKIARRALDTFLSEFAPRTYRLKGIAVLREGGVVAVQSCFRETEVRDYEGYEGGSVFIALGPRLDACELNRRFTQLLQPP